MNLDYEEGEPERISVLDEPIDDETLAALVEHGIELPTWIPDVPPKSTFRIKARILKVTRCTGGTS